MGQIAHRVAGAPHYLALVLLVQPGNDLHQRRLARAVQADNAYLGSVEEAQIDVLEHLLLVLLDGLAHSDHREYNFLVVNCCHKSLLLLCLVTVNHDAYHHQDDDGSKVKPFHHCLRRFSYKKSFRLQNYEKKT